MKYKYISLFALLLALNLLYGQKSASPHYMSDSSYYTGSIVDGKLDGWLKYYSKSGVLVVEGEYKDGDLHGKGKEYYENGEVMIEGEYENGVVLVELIT